MCASPTGFRAPGAAEDFVEVVAHHLEQACRHAEVAERRAAAGAAAVDALDARGREGGAPRGHPRGGPLLRAGARAVGEDETEQALELRLPPRGALTIFLGGFTTSPSSSRGRRPGRAGRPPDLRYGALARPADVD